MAAAAPQLTRRQQLAIREYRPGHVTQRELGIEWGITQSAVSRRLRDARRRLGIQKPGRPMKRIRVPLTSLEAATGD